MSSNGNEDCYNEPDYRPDAYYAEREEYYQDYYNDEPDIDPPTDDDLDFIDGHIEPDYDGEGIPW